MLKQHHIHTTTCSKTRAKMKVRPEKKIWSIYSEHPTFLSLWYSNRVPFPRGSRKIPKRKHQKLLSPLYSLLPRYVTLRNGEEKLYTPRGEKEKKKLPKQPKFKTFKSLKGKACKTNVTWFYFRVDIFPMQTPKLGERKKNIGNRQPFMFGTMQNLPSSKILKETFKKELVTSFHQRKGGEKTATPSLLRVQGSGNPFSP